MFGQNNFASVERIDKLPQMATLIIIYACALSHLQTQSKQI